MAVADGGSPLLEVGGHVLTYLAAVGTGFLGGRLKDMVADVNSAFDQVDEATSAGEHVLRMHAGSHHSPEAIANVFTLRSHLGVLLDRQFGKRERAIISALTLFSDSLDQCDPSSSGALQLGQDATGAVTAVRDAQQGLRAAIAKTRKAKFAAFVGKRSLD
ncbi:MAG: hypothetical protein EON91_02525 [Brevundimonas sp.]|uniref:hypothetical protein n=1 Tax=Brevundimonas sp. TaxID=1871086 RepID=UPI00120BEF35|nr:hypothetical protein [Brevundimonas sp.]RZJ19088.1 MAG: hypothetical protein EON91_02525 [Brevundimonas sp.]